MTSLSDFLHSQPHGTLFADERDGDAWLVAFRPEASAHLLVGMRLGRGASGEPWEMAETSAIAVAGRLSPEDVRRIPLGRLLADARNHLAERERPRAARRLGVRSPSEIDLSEFLSGRRGMPISDDAYARLALHYVLMVQAGDRSPAQTLSDTHPGGGSASQWRQRVREARRRGLLTDSRPGESGGRLTRTAERLLGG